MNCNKVTDTITVWASYIADSVVVVVVRLRGKLVSNVING